jgi:AcrR family transcriptional regulator
MQVKKDEVKNRILKTAEQIFIQVGYEKASIRTISKEAGTTLGNFYNYFKNKEELFAQLIEEDLKKFETLMMHNEETNIDFRNLKQSDLDFFNSFQLPDFGNGLLLLLKSSEGTKFEVLKQNLLDEVSHHFKEHFDEVNHQVSDSFINSLSHQFILGLENILLEDDKDEMLKNHIKFYISGFIGLTGLEVKS